MILSYCLKFSGPRLVHTHENYDENSPQACSVVVSAVQVIYCHQAQARVSQKLPPVTPFTQSTTTVNSNLLFGPLQSISVP